MKKSVFLFVALIISQHLFAQIKTWNGSISNSWNTAGNWTPSNGATAGAPTASDEVIISSSTTPPVLSSGTAFARRVSMNTSSALSISSGATLTVINAGGIAFTMSNATFTNAGTLIATNNNSFVSGECAMNLNTGSIVNNTGSITLNGNLNEGLRLAQCNFNNNTGGVVTTNGINCIRHANANAVFTNAAGATLSGTGTTLSLYINPGNFSNAGTVDFTGNTEMYVTSSQITNSACGKFKLVGTIFIQNSSTLSNSGYFDISGTINNNGGFSNSAVLRYGTLTGTILSGTGNGRVIVNNANNSPTSIFTYPGTSYNGTINGIFTDLAATSSAGTFTAPNTFSPSNALPSGSQTLYAKITPSGGACFYIVPFTYAVLPTISVQPANQTTCSPQATSFSVTASGATSYQWQFSTDGGTTYNNITASAIYSDETTATLNISNTTGLTTYRYRCVVTNLGGSVNSNAAILTVITPTPTPTGTITWTGAISTDWNLSCNWSPSSVPTAGNDVIIPNTTNKPTIGASISALAKTIEVQTSSQLTVAATGSLTVNGSKILASLSGAFHALGTIQNNGLIVVGSTTSSGSYCIVNKGTFNNNTGAEIRVDNATSGGIYNVTNTFNNAALINIGATTSTAGIGIFNDATFNNNTGGEINIDRTTNNGIFNRSGTFTNVAKINLGIAVSVATGLLNDATFNNNTGGEILIDKTSFTGFSNRTNVFNNNAKITIIATSSTGSFLNDATFNNNATGEMYLGNIYNRTNTFTNEGLMSIDYLNGGILQRANFLNKPCGKILLKNGNFTSDGATYSTTNQGLFIATNTIQLSSNPTFTNNGVLKYNALTGTTFTSATNPSVIVNDNATSTTIFTYGGTYDGTINGIFTNATATLSAGTFTAPNTFTPAGTLTPGSQTLYAKITPSGGACVFVVPFTYVVPTPPPAFTLQPSNVSVCTSVATSFSVVASNAATYKWQISTNGGGTFTDIAASSIYTNVTTTTLNISNPTGLSGNQYRCVATGAGGTTNSNPATLSIITQCTVKSIATGNWTSPSTWDAGRVPQAGDNVIIDTPHTVTLSGVSNVKNLEQKGILSLSTLSSRVNTGL